ncbi:hypothetical protein SLOPH_1785 [Spraguea lophii 42_110]|uniref:Uncharacterized protein n=1 Tax=Spraguea lophii (strain 42_110) TaxID=1358809 RepID=S7XW23_SPRLO|nr:hypothetical protein SLOPH_1785 [Spraguea lophii 42_110]
MENTDNLFSEVDNFAKLKEKISTSEQFYTRFNKEIRRKKKASSKTFTQLKKILSEEKFPYHIVNDLTQNGAIVVGRAIQQIKLANIDLFITELIKHNCISTITILTFILSKKQIIGIKDKIKEYLYKCMTEEQNIPFYKLLLIIQRNYNEMMDENIYFYCKTNYHPILKEILENKK